MNKPTFSYHPHLPLKLLVLVAFICCIGAATMPTEMHAKPSKPPKTVNKVYGVFAPWDNVYEKHRGTLGGYHLWGSIYIGTLTWKDGSGVVHSEWGIWQYFGPNGNWKAPTENDIEATAFNFELRPGDNLQVTASDNATCDIYELTTSKAILQDFNLTAGATQALPITPSNTPCLIIFKVDNNVVDMQSFIFNSTNSLSVGGQNE